MKKIFSSKYSTYFAVGLVAIIICAWFSIGHNQADEYYQILEFCNFKLGRFPEKYLPWEYGEKMRSTILPYFVYYIARGLMALGIYNPYTITFILRLIVGIAYWFVTCRLCLFLLPTLKSDTGKKLFVLMSLLMWYVPYVSVRFTPETISGLLFLWGFYSILQSQEENRASFKNYLLAGFLFGLAFFIRIQMSFAIAGFVAWLLFINKTKLKYLFALALTAVIAIGINIVIDHWYYRSWTISPINYFVANIIQHKAVQFGVEPWWYYFLDYILTAVPPLSAILVILFIVGLVKNRRNPLVWTIIPFLLVHFTIDHKELRFLFSITFIFTYIVTLGFEYLNTKPFYQKIHKYVYAVALIICIPMLIYRSTVTANTRVNYFRYLYYNTPEKNTPIFFNPADFENWFYHLDVGFYLNGNLNPISADSTCQIERFLKTNSPKTAFWLAGDYNDTLKSIAGYKADMVYMLYPKWIFHFNFNHWVERSHAWVIYKLSKPN